MLQRFADTLVLSWGRRRAAYAAFFGALAALSQAPLHAFPVLWVALPAFVFLLDGAVSEAGRRLGARLRAAAAVGWWFGFGYFLAGLWWIGGAFLVEADDFGWMMPFAVLIMPAGLAMFWALAGALAALQWSDDWRRILALAVGLTVAEWLRGHVLTGFPWNALGYGFAANSLMMQPAALVGVYGLTLLAVIVFAAPAVFGGASGEARHRFVGLPLAAAILFVAAIGYGAVRLASAADADVAGVRLRIVQPAIPQEEKWQDENRDWIFNSYLELSLGANASYREGEARESDTAPATAAPEGAPEGASEGAPEGTGEKPGALDDVTHLIWPESAFPFILTDEPAALAAIAELLPANTTLITGAARAQGTVRPRDFYNSIFVIGEDGTILDAYDKVHLVPFGEYLPLRPWLEALGIENLTRVPNGFVPGFRRRPMTAAGAPPFSPLICYEIAFPGEVVDAAQRPGWLLNLTNDAWFGATSGPYQHLHQARVRAVEEGLPVVRAANTGISAVIDARGRVRGSIALGDMGTLDSALPAAGAPTVYARFGDVPLAAGLLAVLAVLGASRWRRRPRDH